MHGIVLAGKMGLTPHPPPYTTAYLIMYYGSLLTSMKLKAGGIGLNQFTPGETVVIGPEFFY